MADTWGESDKPVKAASNQGEAWGEGDSAVPASALRKVGDLGLSVAKGVVAVPEALVGLADIPTGGRVGKFLENEGGAFGFRPKQAKEYLGGLQSDDLRDKQQQFQKADGIIDKAGVAISNPSLITNAVAESVPLIGAGAVPARGLMAIGARGVPAAAGGVGPAIPGVLARTVGQKAAPIVAGSIGEGVVAAGSAAEGIRQETADGLMTAGQSGLALASGAATSVFGFAGGKLAQRLGIGDVDTMLTQGAIKTAGAPSAKSIPRQVVEGAIAEGWLEELPQSVSEQVLQNLALDKPWHEGVSDAAVMGTLAGMAMGGAAAGVSGFAQDAQPADAQQPPATPPAPPQPQAGPALALPAPDPGVIAVGGDGTARTPAYQKPSFAGEYADVTDVVPRALAPQPADPVRAAVESAANSGGALSPAALVAIDSGVTPRQESAFKDVPELGAQPPQVNLDDIADPYDRAYYESLFDDDPAPLGAPPVLSAFLQNDDDIPDFDAANNVSEEDFLRALGADEQEIQDAIATTPNRAESAPEGAALPAGPQANVTAGTPEGAGAGAEQPAGPVADAPTNLRDALAKVRAQKQEAANAQAAQAPAPAAAPAPGPAEGAGAVEAAGLTENKVGRKDSAQIAQPESVVGEVQRRAAPSAITPTTTQGTTDATQTAQAQQTSAQPAQAGPAQPAQGLTDAAPAQNPGAQGTPAPGAQGAASQGAAWDALDQKQRTAVLSKAGWRTNKGGLNVIGKRLLNTPWEKINDGTRDTIARNIGQNEAPALTQQAPQATNSEANQSKKERWLKSVADMNRMSGQFGAQIDGVTNGRLSVVGNPNATKQGRALMAAVDEARRAGATNEEIAQAAAGRATAAPQGIAPAPAQETTYNGTRIYPTKVKVGDEVKSMWAAESPDNQRRRAAGERTIGGDSLHDTLEQAQAAAEREAKRDAEQQAAKAEQDAADKARLDAEEARKAANRPKSVVERRKDAILDGPSKIGQGTKRAVITSAVDNGYAIEAKMVYDYAAKKRDQETVDRASRAGYILGVSNENLPLVKAGNEAKARLKEGKYEKPEYRVYQGSDTKAPFREITKTEYDYAQELKAQRAAAPQAAESPTLQTAMGDAGWAGETGQGDTIWTKRANGERYTALLSPDAGSMEVTVLVDAVDTQIASFKVGDAKAAAEAANKAVAQDVAEQSPADDALPEGWTKSINGYTKRPVYRMEQGGGQPFAVVTQVEGMQYEVQIRHGDKQLIVSNQTGALSEVLAKAETELTRMTQADSVTHQDPGEKAEAATPGVVTDSLKKAARNEDTKPSEMRKWLVAEIDKELLQSADRPDYDEAVKRMSEKDAISMFTGNGPLGKNSETGFITFDVPGDGKYKVRNSVRGLLEFRKNVMASQGFKDSGQKRVKPEQNDGVQGGSGGQMAAIANMIDEGDFEAARDYAEAVGIKLEDVKVPRGVRKPQWDRFLKDGTLPPAPWMPSKEWQFQDIGASSFVPESEKRSATLTRVADGSTYVATVKGYLDGSSATYALTKDGKEVGRPSSRNSFTEVMRMAEDAMPEANDKPAPSKASDTGWNMAGTGYGGKRYIGRNITLDDGREVVARIYENAGTYEEAEVREGSKVLLRLTDRYRAQERVDAWLDRMMGKTPALDLMGFKMEPIDDDGGFRLQDGNMIVTVERTDTGLQARHRSAKSSPRLTDQQAVEWAANIRDEPRKSNDGDKPAIPEGYKPAGEPFYRGGKQIQGYAPLTIGERVTMKDSAGQSGVIESLASPDDSGVFASAVVKFDNGLEQMVQFGKLEAAAPQPDAPKLTPAEAKSLMAWEDMGQKDGVKTHALTFYESQADKDAKRGRMIVAKVSKGDRSATAWMVDGEDKTFGMLAQAKKLAEEVGMAKAVADGFVEQVAEQPAQEPATAKKAKPAAASASPIADFGRKIGGARKDVWSGFKDDLNKVVDDDIAAQPLTKVWPAPDYQKLIDAGMDAKSVAAVRALRDEVPAKPRAAWKVKRWAEQVKTLRGLANDVMDGKITVQDMERMGANKGTSLRGMLGRIELYELVGHGKSLEGVRFAQHHYTLYRGRENVSLWVVEKDAGASAFSNWPTEIAIGDTKEQALAAFREKYDSLDLQNAVRKASFDIFSERGSNAFFVGKKIGRNYARLEGPFKTVKEAREYREKNLAALESKLEKYKEIPRERADVNQPRVGVDMRNGQDVTPQMFGEVFGFRGVEFGNWVEQKRRQKDLNDAFDALMDMAAVLGIPTKAISLNGELGLAFGARGSGGVNPAAAHYEPDMVVINLTKKEGAGSLGHEWWHALDNYFSKQRKTNRGSFMTTSTDVGLAARGKDYFYEGGVRQEMIDAFGAVVKAINQTAMKARAAKLDGKRSKEYWTTGEEMSARAFESYLISKLQDQDASNDYLANVVDEKTWDAMAALGMENENSYPYPTAAEIPAIRAGFDHFFQTVETKEDDAGNVAMFSRRSASGNRLPDVVIGHKLGSLSSHPDYEAAKAGNSMAAARIASDLVDDAMVEAVRRAAGNAELIVPVVSVEATGRNKIPLAVARELADRLGSTAETEIVQADSPKRTSMDGLSRLLNPPVFDGPVTQGAAYVLVDDTVTQGGTFASLASHIRDNGGEVAGVVALTGKQYSAKLEPSSELLQQVRDRFQSVEPAFRSATGYGFDALTESEARYLVKHDDAESVRNRILAAGSERVDGGDRGLPQAFARQQSSAAPADSNVRNVATQLLVDGLKAKWTRAPEIIVARNMQDTQIPQAVRDYDETLKSQGATGEARGFIYKGKVYLLSDQLKGPQQIAEVLFHEVLGHYGLRGVFGKGLDSILQQMGTMRRKEVVAKAREYGLFDSDALGGLDKDAASDAQIWAAMSAKERLSAAEEVLAEMAQTQPNIGFVQRAIAAIRNWLRSNVPGFKSLRLTDADIIQKYLLPARRFVTRSKETGAQSLERAMMAFSRGTNEAMTNNDVVGNQGGRSADDTTPGDLLRKLEGTQVVDPNGAPLLVYHGSKSQIDRFDASKTIDGGLHFGSKSQASMRSSKILHPAYLYAENLRRSKDTGSNWKAKIASAKAAGYDGIVYLNRYEGVSKETVFRLHSQGLSEKLDRMSDAEFRRAVPEAEDSYIVFDAKQVIQQNESSAPDSGGAAFSRTTDAAKAVGDTLKSITVTNVKQRAGFKLMDYLGLGLQALGRRQIVDIYGDLVPLAEYNRLVQQMEADKNEGGAEADKLVTRWADLPDEGKLADLMHEATLAQIDPAKPYVGGDDKAKYAMLAGRFNALSQEAKQVYTDTRDAYQAHHAKVRSAIKERIERSELKGERKAALLKQMDDEFFKAVKGVYFPLARFGQYAVTVKGPDGKVESVSRAETKAEAEALRSSLLSAFPRDKGFTVGRVMLSKDFIADRDAVGRGFMTELYQVLDKQDMDAAQRAELEDTLGQLYLSSLPDLSWAKHGIHRKGTPGFSQDARRAYAQNMFHGSRYLAKLRYSDLMQDELTAMQKHVDDWREVEDFDQNSAQRVVDEMNKRHESLMNPKSNPLSTALTSFGFVFHLGLSPASAMVNLSQTALVAYPIMGAKWGFGKASAALLKASAEATKGKNDITGSLNADERAAYDEAVRAGTIDVTMAHDLAGIAQGEDAGVMWKIRPVMRWASFLFHHAERFNRQVTFVASYRLAREAGADKKAAFEQATKATYDGHFDYGAANRPRVMQGNVAKVLLLFKQYGQNMVYTLSRNAYQSIKGTDAEKAEARKVLAGLLTSHAMAAGVLGLPMVTTLLAAASMIGGDDDEPWDAKVALQNMLADTFGQKPAEVLAHGLSRLTPWDISGRVGLDRLIFPDVQEGLEGQRLAESAMVAALGPVAGIGVNVLKGAQHMGEGRYALGLEAMLPSALRGSVKAIRYANEGVQDKSGISILDEVSPAAVAGQALGFSPSQARNAQEGKSAVMAHDRALGERRQELLTKAARAAMDKDAEALAEARKEIAGFNEKNPGRRITPLNITQSVRNRQKRIDQSQDGVYLPKNRRDAMEAGRFALGG